MSIRATRMAFLLPFVLVLSWLGDAPAAAWTQVPPVDASCQVHAVRILVSDLEREARFYTEVLGFERVPEASRDLEVALTSGSLRVILTRLAEVSEPAPRYVREQVTLNFFVGDLDATMTAWRQAGVTFHDDQPQPISIGRAAAFDDPSGNVLHVLEIEGRPAKQAPQVFNLSLNVADIDRAIDIYCHELGFEIFSLGYFPPTVPLRRRGGIPLVIHEEPRPADASAAGNAGRPRERGEHGEHGDCAAGIRVIFEVRDAAATLDRLVARGAWRMASRGDLLFRDPAGIVHEIRSMER